MKEDVVLISTHDLHRAGALRDAFTRAGYGTDLVTPDERLTQPGVVLLVLTGGGADGGGALARQAREELHAPVFAIASGGTLPPALRPGFDEVFDASTRAADVAAVGRLAIERRRLQKITGIVGATDAMREVLERVVQIAPVSATVLVTGESGTGKELVARGIHGLSPRRHKPFIAVNVAALSETLLESEIFGHEKGSFTGAIDARRGLFQLAEGGTIFLDEIGEMPLATQTKLLRVLEQREFFRVGGEKSIRVDVRVIAATNQELPQLVAIGEFRRDLYFRLNVLHIGLPALRERRDDVALLVEAFVTEASQRNDRTFAGISADAMTILRDYAWPGNVRELRNLVESMVVLAPGRTIEASDIPPEFRDGRGRSLLPARIPRSPAIAVDGPGLRPELEFVFRTLVNLRVDMDDLRREFEAYRRETGLIAPGHTWENLSAWELPTGSGATEPPATRNEVSDVVGDAMDGAPAPDPGRGDPVVVFRPGVTMDEMERSAIQAALDSVAGNRRKAAEMLGIGERTLYRKISKFGLDA